ncbi:activated protein kinase catalytic subunit alpha-1 [Seminavis robusta]|uniref:Activated protein kinase catalytic subunit alpha-1 n=1 Tax=Seminavis robusta TaxID=568900 RepID=A0A9N8F262_9STRA|nr:activated protein kinase catalytic subunit alpha-1 [Seminavis robusta]|eukprot:Sro2662_g334000.1 activated protein kinase catalytic subunit alpha-1 (513) ;mRNA; r:3241-4994
MVAPTSDEVKVTAGTMERKDDECDNHHHHRDQKQIQQCLSSCTCSCTAYGKVCPASAMLASKAAVDAVLKLQENSVLFDNKNKKDCMNLRKLDCDDLDVEETLGEGGFCTVKACTLKQHLLCGEEGDPQPLAMKFLKRSIMANRKQFAHGAADLAQEAYFLHALRGHPNILNLYAVTAGDLASNVSMSNNNNNKYGLFITVDRLYSTLEQTLEQWRQEQQEQKEPLFAFITNSMSSEHKQHKRNQFTQRIQIAIQIATAMQYLHQHRVVFRDLKPDNIGFDKDGTLKIFDFGLAKELKPNESHADGRYQLTGNTGSRRYMAPEVAKELPYNQTVDVYSFGILLHELLSGEKPFYGYSSAKHMANVVMGGERPHVDKHWPMNLQCLMKRCWSPFPNARPDFSTILQTLQEVLLAQQQQQPQHHNHPHKEPQDCSTTSPEPTTTTSSPTTKTRSTSLMVPSGGLAALLRPKRATRLRSHGSHDDSSPPPSIPRPYLGKRGMSLGGLFSSSSFRK